MRVVKAGEFYRHFKGNYYQVITLAHHSETDEILVVYQALYGEYKVCARPYDMFISKVDKEKYPKAGQEYRFEKVEPPFSEEGIEKANIPKEGIEKANLLEEDIEKANFPEEVAQAKSDFLMEFLDAKSVKQKIELLDIMKNELDDHVINSICVSLDIPFVEGTMFEKYDSIRRVLETKEKYEKRR